LKQAIHTNGTADHGSWFLQQAQIKALTQLHLGLCGIDFVGKIESCSGMATIHEYGHIDTRWHSLDQMFVQVIVHDLAGSFEINRNQCLGVFKENETCQ
jgi:hypothetical protein